MFASEEITRWKGYLAAGRWLANDAPPDILSALDEIERLRKALEVYANAENWQEHLVDGDEWLLGSGPETARAALKGGTGMTEAKATYIPSTTNTVEDDMQIENDEHMIGWKCPGCGRCYSPYMMECPHCQPKITHSSTTHGLWE